MNEIERAERIIAGYLGRKHCWLTGRGTSAIYAVLKVISDIAGTGELILPTIGCASLAQVPALAGFTPVFADIRLDDYTIDLDDLARKTTARTKAIMPVHIFGYPAAMEAIESFARPRGLFVIEDACHGLGGRYGGKKLGAWGDFSILSFGGTKIVNIGGGGAVATDNDEFADRLRKHLALLPKKPDSSNFGLLSLSHRNLYHGLVDLLRSDPTVTVAESFQAVTSLYAGWLVHQWYGDDTAARRLSDAFTALEVRNKNRLERAAYYADCLQVHGLRHPPAEVWQRAGVVWRYSFLARDARQCLRLTEHLRKAGIHVSNHYWSLADLTANEKSLPNSGEFSRCVLNLWTDDTVDDAYLERTRAAVMAFKE